MAFNRYAGIGILLKPCGLTLQRMLSFAGELRAVVSEEHAIADILCEIFLAAGANRAAHACRAAFTSDGGRARRGFAGAEEKRRDDCKRRDKFIHRSTPRFLTILCVCLCLIKYK